MLNHKDVQQALSARIDGEPTGVDDDAVDAHLAHCDECRAYWDKMTSLSHSLIYAEVDGGMAPPADLSEAILAGVEPEWRKQARRRIIGVSVGRIALGFLSILFIFQAVMLINESGALMLTSADGEILAVDAQPQLAALIVQAAAFKLGAAMAFGYCAWRPSHIPPLFLVVGTMFAFTIGFTMRDWVLAGSSEHFTDLLVLFVSCLALGWTWLSERGPELRRAWRTLNAVPSDTFS
ncbi:zf-HC2 domain-containing protein [Corynebacterium breve]|uniref:Zf-HC2 domain-containing protein n=1 Tax=Corynebacterium breve TaxID=3049799 RepID=A0ABY8VH67_9CORY|nr:zf-HC2 domain-containing protein [Corynebacterium breve]WIM68432.1 zf-HC2 domain-containing protein [Corynebacterium breve]